MHKKILDYDAIRERIRPYLEKYGTQAKAAKALGLQQPTVSTLLLGDRDPSLETLARIGMNENVSLDYIVFGIDRNRIF
tara:strand:+ start:141 stop:377 length:237 start_codon:yes stop_codon:yes gene_type:complete